VEAILQRLGRPGDGVRATSNIEHLEGRAMARDPVCGMQVDEKKAAATSVYKGTTYYFCATACKAAFEKNPETYSRKTGTYMTVGR
jgi:Cu+-exporting ATPase